jgi:hypothetical protein
MLGDFVGSLCIIIDCRAFFISNCCPLRSAALRRFCGLFGTLLLIQTGAAPWRNSTVPCCPTTPRKWYSSRPTATSSPGSGFFGTSSMLMCAWSDTKPVGYFAGLLSSPGLTMMRLSARWSSQLRFEQSSPCPFLTGGMFTNLM